MDPHPTMNVLFHCTDQAFANNSNFQAVIDQLSKEDKKLHCQGLAQELCGKVAELLDVSLADIFAGAWKKLWSLQKYLDKNKYPPEKIVLAPLAEHTITSQHLPCIEILVNEAPVSKIEFQIDLALKLQGFTLKIQDGKIKEAFTGTCAGKGTLAYQNVPLLEKETAAVPLPGSLKFGEGIPIPRLTTNLR